jgi:hypothetical protein
MLLIIHLLIAFRRLREVDYYRDDPVVLRLMGLRKMPDVWTISRALSKMEETGVENGCYLSRSPVIEGLIRGNFSRLTLDRKCRSYSRAIRFNPSACFEPRIISLLHQLH